MAELINQIAAFIESLILLIGYPGIFFMLLLENLFPPVPTEPLMPFAGMLVAQGQITFVGAWIAAVSGATVGSVLLYAIGKWANESVIRGLVRRHGRLIGITEDEIDKAAQAFNRYGGIAVFFGRMVPMLRGPVSLVAGMSRMNVPIFTLFSALSAAVASGTWLIIGVLLGEGWPIVIELIREAEPVLPIIALVIVVALIVYFVARRWLRAGQLASAPELPS
ncbi:MAG: DedA family protein [Anaerolineae bacterium]|nr:DedA family protein [Anaerolineae bacterium]MDW8172901.1 DedA family protein [Anaerolineae bacterium]